MIREKILIENFNIYSDYLLPILKKSCPQSEFGMHGLCTHTQAVVFRGIDYALYCKENPLPVVFACAFHDIARIDNSSDPEHGHRAVPIAAKIMEQLPKEYQITDSEKKAVLYAIENHTNGMYAKEYISGCLWDADRTRLSWLFGFQRKFFYSDYAANVASTPAQIYLEYQKKIFPHLKWDKTY